MNQITVKEMAAALNREVKKGNGNKYLIGADDNEGNGYHGIFYEVSQAEDGIEYLISDSVETNPKNLMIIG